MKKSEWFKWVSQFSTEKRTVLNKLLLELGKCEIPYEKAADQIKYLYEQKG